jgi:hypothetical protein
MARCFCGVELIIRRVDTSGVVGFGSARLPGYEVADVDLGLTAPRDEAERCHGAA